MPDINDMIISKYLRKEDAEDPIVVTTKLTQQEVLAGDDHKTCWILYFRELSKGMVLNNTTMKVLAQAFGRASEGWAGKRVELYNDPNVSFAGRVVGGLRLRPLKNPPADAAPVSPTKPKTSPPKGKKKAAAVEEPAAGEDFNDQIPM